MLPDLSLLLGLFLGLLQLEAAGTGAEIDPLRAIAGTAATTLVVAMLCRLAADRAIAAVEERDADALLRAGRFAGLWPFTGWLACLYAFDWPQFVASTIPRAWWMVPHVVMLAPLGVMFAAGWIAVRRVQARFTSSAPTAWGAVKAGLRRNALVLAPIGVLTAVLEAFTALKALGVPGVRRFLLIHQSFHDVESLVVLAIMALLGWFAPTIVRRTLRSKPLPAGELRTQIERLCQALNVRYRDVLLWETEGRVLNALVVGLTGRTRYVIVSDALIDALPVNEVLAVVAHEAGHARLRHLPAYFAVSIASLLLMRSAQEALPSTFGGMEIVLQLLFLGFFWFGMLGWLSRRFERQADVFGAQNAGALTPDAPPVELPGAPSPLPYGAATMISALDGVVARAGAGRAHRHGSPAERTEFLAAYATDAGVRGEFEKDTRRLRMAIRGFVVVALVLTAVRIPGGIERGEALLPLSEAEDVTLSAHEDRKAGNVEEAAKGYERARGLFLESVKLAERRPHDDEMKALAALGTFDAADLSLHHLGRPDEARAGFERVLERVAGLGDGRGGPLVFNAKIDLGRLALARADDKGKGVAEAKKLLEEARRVEAPGESRYRDARIRLLESAIRLRDPDPAVAAKAEADLRRQSKPANDEEQWQELARDAAEDLKHAGK